MSAPTCPKCGDTGSLSGDIDGFLDCASCDAAQRRNEMRNYLLGLSPMMDAESKAWAAYQFALSRPVTQQPVAWGILSDTCPELTNDPVLGNYWERKGRMVTPLYAFPLPEAASAAQECGNCPKQTVYGEATCGQCLAAQDARDAARYRWLRHGDNDEKVIQHGPLADDFVYLPRNFKLDEMIDAAIATGETKS